MKTTIFQIAIIFAITLFSGCDKEAGTGTEPVNPDKETKLEYSNRAYTSMWPDNIRDVTILTEGTFNIQPLDNEVVTVELIDAKKIRVTAKKVGKTEVLIVDKDNIEHAFFINVRDNIDYLWDEWADRFVLDLKVAKPEIEAAIIKDIADKVAFIVGGQVSFNNLKKTFKTYSGKRVSGEYEFDIYSKKMAFIYNDTKESYKIIDYPNDGSILTLEADRTDYYKQLYPDEEIERVVYSHDISLWRNEFSPR